MTNQIYPLKLAIAGAAGRMGRTLVAALREAEIAPDWQLVGAVSSTEREIDGVSCISDRSYAFRCAEVVIDFSHGSQAVANLQAAASAGAACLIGTTNLPPEAEAEIRAAGEDIAVLHAPNASLAVAVLSELVAHAALALDESFDVEILDFHHGAKRDAPSGTALALAGVAQASRRLLDERNGTVRMLPGFLPSIESTGDRQPPRQSGTIGTASLRGGSTGGEHRVIFAGYGERLELHHLAHDRTPYAHGALHLARILYNAPPGVHTVSSLLKRPPPTPETGYPYA